jgi:tRNA-dihydrouridine synthase B
MTDNIKKTIQIISDRKLWLAPLAGYTDIYYRQIAKTCGADVLVSEMVSADGIRHSVTKMMPYIVFDEKERPYGVQLFGDDPLTMSIAAQKLIPYKPDFIDINMGCPVKKVVKRTAGSALMTVPDTAAAITREVSKVCHDNNIPLTVKIRAGWDFDNLNGVEFAQLMEASGADLIAVHPRTRSQLFTGRSNWDIIRQVKEKVKVPVVGNGDIFSPEDALQMLDETGCDSLMMGRGAIGNPWLFTYIRSMLDNGEYQMQSPKQKLPLILTHLDMIYKSSDSKKMYQIRSHLAHYTKGLIGAGKARDIIFQSLDYELIKKTLEELFYGKRD